MKNRPWTATGKLAATLGVALAFLAVTLVTARPSKAGSSTLQDPPKTVVKVEVKVEAKAVEVPAQKAEVNEAVTTKVMVAEEVVIGGPAANVEALTTQFLQQYRSILATELRVFSMSSQPTSPQRREVAIEGGKALKKAAAKMAEAQQGMMNGRGVQEMPNPRQLARDAMKAVAKTKLSADQLKRYEDELDRRAQDQRESVMLNLVAGLDQLLILNADQRKKLCETLLSHWDDNDYPTIDTVTMYEGYFPMIPDQQLNPILNDAQKKIWNSAMKIQFSSIRNFAFNVQIANGGEVNDPGEDADVKAAFAPEVKK